jgi:hypothetical protein
VLRAERQVQTTDLDREVASSCHEHSSVIDLCIPDTVYDSNTLFRL